MREWQQLGQRRGARVRLIAPLRPSVAMHREVEPHLSDKDRLADKTITRDEQEC